MPTRVPALIGLALLLFAAPIFAAEAAPDDAVTLINSGFEQGHKPWSFASPHGTKQKIVSNEPDKARTGKAALHLWNYSENATSRFARASQRVPQMEPGIYALSVWARGDGELRLIIRTQRSRRMIVDDTWRRYQIVFEVEQRKDVTLTLDTLDDIWIDDVTLSAADGETQAKWEKQEQARQQLGYVPYAHSAQPPHPNPKQRVTDPVDRAVPIEDRVLFYDPMYEPSWNTHVDRMAQWFERRGFRILDAEQLREWMHDKVKSDGAYGSVVVMAMGLVPKSILGDEATHGKRGDLLVRRYMDHGGRVVWTGNVPLYIMQAETGAHRSIDAMGRAIGVLNYQDWSQPDEVPRFTDAGMRWGLQFPGSLDRPVPTGEVTLPLSTNHEGTRAAIWLLTTNPAYPLSGFVCSSFGLDGRQTKKLEDFYRMAVYHGEPVQLPEPIDTSDGETGENAALQLSLRAKEAARRAVVRGETVDVTINLPGQRKEAVDVRVTLTDHAPALSTYELARLDEAESKRRIAAYQKSRSDQAPLWQRHITVNAGDSQARLQLDTSRFALGDYQLSAGVTTSSADAGVSTYEPLAICASPREPAVDFLMRTSKLPSSPGRLIPIVKELDRLGLSAEAYASNVTGLFADMMLRRGRRFVVYAPLYDTLKNMRIGAGGEKYENPWASDKPGLSSVSGAATRRAAREKMRRYARRMKAYPAFDDMFTCSDDFNARGGWDWHPENVAEFKENTGLPDAPRPEAFLNVSPRYDAALDGLEHADPIVADDNPWVQWNLFLAGVVGRYGGAVSDGIRDEIPNGRAFPVHGSLLWPAYQVRAGMYPPRKYGARQGYSAIGYYCYLDYWQPTVGYIYWNEAVRMGNRDMPGPWILMDGGYHDTYGRHYLRNAFHMHMASGASGINYWMWDNIGPEAKQEMQKLGGLLDRFGPTLARLDTADTDVALLVPFTEACYRWTHPLNSLWRFANLAQAHVPAQVISEEEVGQTSHRTILLSDVRHLRRSSKIALEKLIAQGGTVILDNDCTVPIEGAVQLDISLYRGSKKRVGREKPYGKADIIRTIREALRPYMDITWDSPDYTTVVRPMRSADGSRYLYVVDTDDHEEFQFYADNVMWPAKQGRDATASEAEQQAFFEAHGMNSFEKPTTLRVRFPADALPEDAVLVDVFAGRVLKAESLGNGWRQVTVDAVRYGGTLLALRDASEVGVTLTAPSQVQRGEKVSWSAALRDARRGRALGGVWPLEIELRRPDGEVSRELDGTRATDGGAFEGTLRIGVNAPAGEWTLRVTDLASDRTAERIVTVK